MLDNLARKHIFLFFSVIFSLFIFLWSLDLMVSVFQATGGETVNKVIAITSNPFISLFIGLFITAVIQSSSTCTSLIVAIVASGSMSLENAIPMVMGANIGTTLTSTIVSLGYITNDKEFKRAIAAGVLHDFFNIITVIVLFPLQYYYNLLSNSSNFIARVINMTFGISGNNDVTQNKIFSYSNNFLSDVIQSKLLLAILACLMLFVSIKILSKIIYNNVFIRAKTKLNEVFFSNPIKPLVLGTVVTSFVQSSSITTSLIVPFAATGSIKLRKLFPFIIGSNIGTTITALIASIYKSEAALSIALAHLIFNLFGTLIFLLFPMVRNIPLKYAQQFGTMTMRYRVIGFIYVLVIFFLLPLSLIFINKL